jgi:hypothetical protein
MLTSSGFTVRWAFISYELHWWFVSFHIASCIVMHYCVGFAISIVSHRNAHRVVLYRHYPQIVLYILGSQGLK